MQMQMQMQMQLQMQMQMQMHGAPGKHLAPRRKLDLHRLAQRTRTASQRTRRAGLDPHSLAT